MSGKDESYLIVLNGPLQGGVFVLSKLSVFEIGRGDGCHIKLPDENCGFNHARITVRRGEWRFTNLNEERGSSINDIKVDNRVLEGFEVIRVGKTELQFSLEPPARGEDGGAAVAQQDPNRESRSVGVAPTMMSPTPPAAAPPAPPAPAAAPAPPAPPVAPAPPAPAAAPTPPAPAAPAAAPAPPAPAAPAPAATPSAPPPAPRPAPAAAPAPAAPPPAPAAAPPPPKPGPAPAPMPPAAPPAAPPPLAPAATATATPPADEWVSSRTEDLAGLEIPAASNPGATSRGYRVKVIDGCDGDLGRVIDFRPGTMCVIGRSVSSDFVLCDGKISRAHCSLELRDGVLILCDLDSSNGTVVNGERVQKTVIKPGDYIRLGFTVLGCEEIDFPG